MCGRLPRLSLHDAARNHFGIQRAVAWPLSVCPQGAFDGPAALANRAQPGSGFFQSALFTSLSPRCGSPNPVPRPQKPIDTDSIHIAAPRLPQTRAAPFKWLYRKRPGLLQFHLTCNSCLPGRFRYSTNTSGPLRWVARCGAQAGRLRIEAWCLPAWLPPGPPRSCPW
jgi:hypothetical protein